MLGTEDHAPIAGLRVSVDGEEFLSGPAASSYRLFQDRYLFCAAKPVYAMAIATRISPRTWPDVVEPFDVSGASGTVGFDVHLLDVLGHRLPLRKPNLWEYIVTAPNRHAALVTSGMRRAHRRVKSDKQLPGEYSEILFGWIIAEMLQRRRHERLDQVVEWMVPAIAGSARLAMRPTRELLERDQSEFVDPHALATNGRTVPILYASSERSRSLASVPYGPFGSVADLVACYRGLLSPSSWQVIGSAFHELLDLLAANTESDEPFVGGFTNFRHIDRELTGVFGQLAAGGAFAAGIDLRTRSAWGYVSDVFVADERARRPMVVDGVKSALGVGAS